MPVVDAYQAAAAEAVAPVRAGLRRRDEHAATEDAPVLVELVLQLGHQPHGEDRLPRIAGAGSAATEIVVVGGEEERVGPAQPLQQIGAPEEADVEPMDPEGATAVDVGLPLIGIAGLADHLGPRQRFLVNRFLRVLSQRQGTGSNRTSATVAIVIQPRGRGTRRSIIAEYLASAEL